jgi:hypothetical protein
MYRDDDHARSERANALIDEIAGLEREKLARTSVEQRLEDARRELAALQPSTDPAHRPPGLAAHLIVFGAAACTTAAAYLLLF